MKHLVRTAILLLATLPLLALTPTTAQAMPSGEYGYYNGNVVFFVSAGTLVNAQPSLLEHAPPFYLLTFPVAPGTSGPITLPSGYQPQENGNMQAPAPWHDHLLPAIPGAGYSPAMRVVLLRYTQSYAASPDFQPVTSLTDLAAAKQAGKFAVISAGAADPYELVRNDVLIRPVIHN